MKSLAFDIEELADHLNLGPKFYVAGYSMGGQVVWSCLKYIRHRFDSNLATFQASYINNHIIFVELYVIYMIYLVTLTGFQELFLLLQPLITGGLTYL